MQIYQKFTALWTFASKHLARLRLQVVFKKS